MKRARDDGDSTTTQGRDDVDCLTKDSIVKYEHQVGGHGDALFTYKQPTEQQKGHLLKLCLQTELDFYLEMQSATQKSNLELFKMRSFTPNFFKVCKLSLGENGQQKELIEMNDLCFRVSKPCCMDLKMGTATVAPDYADEEKQKRMKYWDDIGTTKACGFRLSGLKMYDSTEKKWSVRDNSWGKNLKQETAIDCFRSFVPNHLKSILIPIWKKRLSEIKDWFKQYCTKKFIGSSLLFIYDGELLSNENSNTNEIDESLVKLYMIDFAHALPRKSNDDNGYLFGLETLESLLDSFLSESP